MVDQEPTEFGWYLLRRMEARRPPLTQAELARLTGLGQATISRWIYAPGKPKDDKLEPLADVLGVGLGEILTAAGYGPRNTEIAESLAALRPAMDPLAEEISRMLAPESPIPEADRVALRTILDRLIDPHRRQMRRRRSA